MNDQAEPKKREGAPALIRTMPTRHRQFPKQEHSTATVEAILEATARVLAREGYEGRPRTRSPRCPATAWASSMTTSRTSRRSMDWSPPGSSRFTPPPKSSRAKSFCERTPVPGCRLGCGAAVCPAHARVSGEGTCRPQAGRTPGAAFMPCTRLTPVLLRGFRGVVRRTGPLLASSDHRAAPESNR